MKNKIEAEKLDEMFDDSKDISRYIDWESAKHLNIAPRRINVDFPEWMITCLDQIAGTIGISRQALIKTWINERLKQENPNRGKMQG